MRSSIILVFLLAVGGCSSEEPLSTEPSQAASQILLWVPVGTSVTDAQTIMAKHHFTCSVTRKGKWGNLKDVDFLFCDYSSNDFLVKRRWQAALFLVENKVSSAEVATYLVGP
jgi:hypothetical protein